MDAVILGLHHGHLTLAAGHHIDHLAGVFLGHVNAQFLDGLTFYTIDVLDDDLGLSHLELISLAAHLLDEHRQVQHAASEDVPCVLILGALDAQGQVLVQLTLQTVPDVARGHILAVPAEER